MIRVEPSIPSVKGFRVTGVHAGMKSESRLDMTLIASDRPCTAAAIFTTNQVKAAPVLLSEEHMRLSAGQMRAVVVNTTCANACTGEIGLKNAAQMASWAAQRLGCTPQQIFVMSTGVIGTHLPMKKIEHGIELAVGTLQPARWAEAARGIMTTDTRPKQASAQVISSHGTYTIAGISKGAGMIAPNMATMLGVVVTDADLSVMQAQSALRTAADVSFNRIVVDGDTSTNDTVLLMASGSSGVRIEDAHDLAQFQEALNAVCISLAQQIVRDGEGVTKFITLHISGAADAAAARQIGNTIATSALVKTAFYGNDANWGRIIAAAGRAGVSFDPAQARLWMHPGEALPEEGRGLLLFENGMPTPYDEEQATAIISEPSIYVTLDCGQGGAEAVLWTCDLSHDYVTINGAYRT